ncbi:MAG: hypothetical protein ABIC04_07845 [Nanoarchaeota archaeon]
MKITWILLIFLIVGAFIITSSYDLNLKRTEDRRTFIGKFAIWIVNVFKNAAKTVGYVVKLDWFPDNEINNTDKTKVINYTNYIVEN